MELLNKSIKVLLIDDDESTYYTIKDLLVYTEFGEINLDWAYDYENGIKQISKSQYDVFIIDYRLGPRTGIELISEAISRGCNRPMILLTAYNDRKLEVESIMHGAADFINKNNLNTDLIERSLHYTIERKKAESALRESEDRYRRITEALSDYIYTVCLQNGKHLRTVRSSTCMKLTGYDSKEYDANSNLWIDMVHEEDLGKYKNHGEFNQVESDFSDESHGTGLGLAIARRITDSNNGTISVTSKPGKGSTFTVKLPCIELSETKEKTEEQLEYSYPESVKDLYF